MEIGAKAAHKMLVKLTTGVNFTNHFVQGASVPAHGVYRKRHHSVSPTKLGLFLVAYITRIYYNIYLTTHSADWPW